MKKKSPGTCGIMKVCLLFTLVIVLSGVSLVFFLAAQKENNQYPSFQVQSSKDVAGLHGSVPIQPLKAEVKSVPLSTTTNRAATPSWKQIHFIHVPKCGGTSMTSLLRDIQCHSDPVGNADCCLNPGFCDWHAHRRCSTIMGCINHFPNRYGYR
jgi:hypothetical protein